MPVLREEDLFKGFTIGEWDVLPAKGILRHGDREEHPEPKVFAVLIALARHNGDLVTKEQLIDEVWEGRAFDDQPIQRCIALLRRHFQDTKPYQHIETLQRRGYRLVNPVQLHYPCDSLPPRSSTRKPGATSYRWKLVPVAIAIIAVATVIALSYLGSSNPLDQFHDLAGYRLVLEYRDADLGDIDGHIFTLTPMETVEFIEGGDRGIFSLNAGAGEIRGPIIDAQYHDLPVMFFDPPDDDFDQVIFVLPYEPEDIKRLIEVGRVHETARIVTEGLTLQIDSKIRLIEQDRGTLIRVDLESGK
jgi:DNA-binding winged helix-turn-helix (wHTH) protein